MIENIDNVENVIPTNQDKKLSGYLKIVTVFIAFISAVVIVYILAALKEILVPVTIAILLTLLFHPIVIFLSRRNVPKWVSIILILLGISITYYLLLLLLIPELYEIPARLSGYLQRLYIYTSNAASALNISIAKLDLIKEINLKRMSGNILVERIMNVGVNSTMLSTFYGLLGDMLLTLLFFIFMISGKTLFELKIQRAFTESRGEIFNTIKIIDEQIQQYILNEAVIGFFYGTLISITFFSLGIEFAITFGFLAFILNFIPKIGIIISAVLPVLFVLFLYGFSYKLLVLFIVLLAAVYIIIRYIEPKYIYNLINLSPVFVIFSIIFWGWIWGIVGIYLAFPIAAVLKILFSNIKPLKPLAIIIGSRVNLHKDSLLSG